MSEDYRPHSSRRELFHYKRFRVTVSQQSTYMLWYNARLVLMGPRDKVIERFQGVVKDAQEFRSE